MHRNASSSPKPTNHWRPAFHFCPQYTDASEPFGLFHKDNRWHMFYQTLPTGDNRENNAWGHMYTENFLTWNREPLPIREDGGRIESAAVIYDPSNHSGLTPNELGIVTIYTVDYHGENRELHLAYSRDGGSYWRIYPHKLVISPLTGPELMNEFQHPFIFWHTEAKCYVLVVGFPERRLVQFYTSNDLKNWTYRSEFGNEGDVSMPWEYPCLREIEIINTNGRMKWVLIVSGGGPYKGFSGIQYFVGTFDDFIYKNDSNEEVLYLDFGKDFYGATIFDHHEDYVMQGLMTNKAYAEHMPTLPWKGVMSLPRQLMLLKTISPKGPRLINRPQMYFNNPKLWIETINRYHYTLREDKPFRGSNTSDSYVIQFSVELENIKMIGVKVLQKGETDQETLVGYITETSELFLDRTKSGLNISENFASRESVYLPLEDEGILELKVVVDKIIVEAFGCDGFRAISDLVFPVENSFLWEIFVVGGKCKLKDFIVSEWLGSD